MSVQEIKLKTHIKLANLLSLSLLGSTTNLCLAINWPHMCLSLGGSSVSLNSISLSCPLPGPISEIKQENEILLLPKKCIVSGLRDHVQIKPFQNFE